MSEPRIVRKCPKCGDVQLVPLSEMPRLDEYFHCSKCGFVGQEREADSEKKPGDEDS